MIPGHLTPDRPNICAYANFTEPLSCFGRVRIARGLVRKRRRCTSASTSERAPRNCDPRYPRTRAAKEMNLDLETKKPVERAWNESVIALEAVMRQSWLESSLLPLSNTINNFRGYKRLQDSQESLRNRLPVSRAPNTPRSSPYARPSALNSWVRNTRRRNWRIH